MRKPRYAPGSRPKTLPPGYDVQETQSSLGVRWNVLRSGVPVGAYATEDAARSSARKHAKRNAPHA